jgi:hypothetical protein
MWLVEAGRETQQGCHQSYEQATRQNDGNNHTMEEHTPKISEALEFSHLFRNICAPQ